MKGANKKAADVYALPLPYRIKHVPALVPHNPLSVVMYLWSLYSKLPSQKVHKGLLDYDKNSVRPHGVKVVDLDSAMELWQQGFFGKGSLSRSEPSWFGRTARRLGLNGGELTLEEITEMRRAKRREFKKDRERQQKIELYEKMKLEGKEIPANLQPSSEEQDNKNEGDDNSKANARKEDLNLVRGDTIIKLEYLQLNAYETIYLSLGLGVLEVDNVGIAELLSLMLSSKQHFHNYVVYHYFRSLGWCVRDGIKFGVDMLLYRRGPPFQHAEFTAMVLDETRELDWWWIHANMRVVSGAKKTLMLVYVDAPTPQWESITTVKAFRNLLKQVKINPVVFSRFTPAKNRD